MPHGKCKECGKKVHGWAILYGDNKCDECGGEIEITAIGESEAEKDV